MRVDGRIRVARIQAIAASLRYPHLLLLPRHVRRPMARALEQVRPLCTPQGIFTHPYAPPIGGRPYARYLTGLRWMAQGRRVPLVAHVSVTDRCPHDCPRCSNLGDSTEDPPAALLTNLVGRLREAGTVRVAFTGGEPLVRGDLERLIASCGADISVQLFTSGYGVSRARARTLRDAGLEVAFVSVDDWRSQVHDEGRRFPGSHAQALSALRAFSAEGVHTVAQGVASAGLLEGEHLERYIRMCTEAGASELMLLEPVPVRGSAGCEQLGDEGSARLAALHTRAACDASLPKIMTMSLLESGGFLGCQAGVTFLYVAAGGDVYPCDFVPLSFGNAHREPLDEVMARLARCIPSPACRCMARVLPCCGAGRKLAWQQTREALASYEPGPLPALMNWYGRNQHGG